MKNLSQYNFSMPDKETARKGEPRAFVRVALLLLGIVLGQFILYGPSLCGRRILLPLDILASRGFYIPQTPEVEKVRVKDGTLADLICTAEPQRRFAISEFGTGRLPMWAPYHYAGAPFVWPKFSPFLLFQCCTSSPVVLAWSQLLVALVAGAGAYLFLRRALVISFWPSVICAWCYPLTGFFILWQGFFTVPPVCWLPWLLLAVEQTVREGGGMAAFGLAVVTWLVVVSGQLDVAGQVLLVSGLYAFARIVRRYSGGNQNDELGSSQVGDAKVSIRNIIDSPWRGRGKVIRLAAGWTLGLMLASPYVLPVLEYTQTGARMVRRGAGSEERPPIGAKALPQIVFPNIFGTPQQPSLRFAGGFPQQESSASSYAGLLTTLLAVPLALASRRHLAAALLWVLLSILALSWCLNLPGFVTLLRLPGLNMMSYDRLVFLAGFGLLVLAAIGFEALLSEDLGWRNWMWFPLLLLAGLCAFCLYRTFHLPEPIASQIAATVSAGKSADWIHSLADVKQAQSWFVHYYAMSAVWCGIGVLGWALLRNGKLRGIRLISCYGAMVIAELLWFGYGRNVQSDPALYYPTIPVLESVAKAPAGRIIGFGCLPATTAYMAGLHDIRGYDAVDPARLVELVLSTAEPISIKPQYAPTMEMAPKADITPSGDIKLPPVLDMLNVRYVIFRGSPFPGTHALLKGFDYWVLQNPRALPRAFVPESVELVTNDALRVEKIESSDFNPRKVAYVETPVSLPPVCRGTAEITDEIPTRVDLSVKMETPGLVVLADLWDKGWHAYLNGKEVPILRANHAIRGVVVPAGSQTLVFRYAPASFTLGLELAGTAAVVLLGWLGVCLWYREKGEF